MGTKAPLVKQIMTAIEGAAYVEPAPLQDYHTANAVKAALRRKDPFNRLSGVREALRHYRVSSWLCDDGRIRLVKAGVDVLLLG
jgi:PIN domain nuclease of toxin-antitoxin system